jgi:hypothetical protein
MARITHITEGVAFGLLMAVLASLLALVMFGGAL